MSLIFEKYVFVFCRIVWEDSVYLDDEVCVDRQEKNDDDDGDDEDEDRIPLECLVF